MRANRTLGLVLAGTLVLAGCSGGDDATAGNLLAGGETVVTTPGGVDGEGPADAERGDLAEGTDGLVADRTDEAAAVGEVGDTAVTDMDGASTTGADDAATPVAPAPGGDGEREAPQAGSLRGGSVDDNIDFADYLAYRQQFLSTGIPMHDRDVSERQVIAVTDGDGLPVLGADVVLQGADGVLVHARTNADGTVRLFPLAAGASDDEPLSATVTLGDQVQELDLPRGSTRHEVTLPAQALADPVALDVHFLLDATGSMSDELDRLKATIASVATRIGELPTATDLQLGLTAYRDLEDAYVTKTYDFTSDVGAFSDGLDQVVADGGGDEPEALSEALQAALDEPSWRDGRTLKVMFLVADAPPQLDRQADYAVEMVRAAEQGVMIVPLASSGTSDQGEYVFRQLALFTGGPFLFLTYGADGASPGDDTPHHVTGYDVLALDDLVVKVIEDQLAHLTGAPVTPPQQ